MSEYLLGIDNGGTFSKAALYDLRGAEIAHAAVKTKLLMPAEGFTERDGDDFWEATAGAIREVLDDSGVSPNEIISLATTGHGNGLYLAGRDGKLPYNGIISTDSRAKDYVKSWYGNGTKKRVFPKTLQSVWAGQPVAILAWFKDNNPEALADAQWIFMCKDYIRYRLTGEAYAELTDMSGTSLVNLRTMAYDEELLREFGLSDLIGKLPPLKLSTDICGRVTRQAAEKTGLSEGTPVAGGLFDIDACAVATGVTNKEKLCIVAGTWSINQFVSDELLVSEDLFMESAFCVPGKWLILEGSATSAGNLEWYIARFLGEEERKASEKGESVFDVCNAMVKSAEPGAKGVLFLPFLFGSNVSPDASACLLGLKGHQGKADLLRAVYEGIALCHRHHAEKLVSLGADPPVISISGGAARSAEWVRIFADVFQKRIEVTRGTELGTLGAALCAGVAAGCFDSFSHAVNAMVHVAYVCEPRPEYAGIYLKKYENYKKAVERLLPLWEAM